MVTGDPNRTSNTRSKRSELKSVNILLVGLFIYLFGQLNSGDDHHDMLRTHLWGMRARESGLRTINSNDSYTSAYNSGLNCVAKGCVN